MGAAIAILGYASQFASILPSLIAAGQSLSPIIKQFQGTLTDMQVEKRGPTAAEWDALNAYSKSLHDQMQAP